MSYVARALFVLGIALATGPGIASAQHDGEGVNDPLVEVAQELTEIDDREAHDAVHSGHDLGHGNAGPMQSQMYEFRTDLAIYTLIVFGVLLAILATGAWPKISAALLDRELRIEKNLADAEAKHEEAKRLLAEHEARLASSADQVREMLEEARRDAEGTKEAIVAEARTAADQERVRALRDIEIARDEALQTLAQRSGNLAVDLAGKVLGQAITPDRHAALIREGLAQLGQAGSNAN
ncbi:MAG: ATP synthase F0 subunit B [Planctomycetales bacterium]|nr:ATP synthase F0 subunit B [Planctomycetales bacterium]